MKEVIFDWIKNLAYYMILVSAFLHILPNEAYRKYIRLFTGMILILLLSSSILSLFGVDTEELSFINMKEYRDKLDEITEETKYLYDIDAASYVVGESRENMETKNIKINKIELGE